jgi:hypothetical protein
MPTFIQSITLECRAGSKSAVYALQVEAVTGGCLVHFQNGRIGGTLKTGTKTAAGPVSEAEAMSIFDRVVKEKMKSSPPYVRVDGDGQAFTAVAKELTERLTGLVLQLSNDIDDDDPRAVERYINDPAYMAQHKADGERRAIRLVKGEAVPIGIKKKSLQVPLQEEIARSLNGIVCTLDAEIIGNQLYAFDLLDLDGADLRPQPCVERKRILNTLSDRFGGNITVLADAFTAAEKRALYEQTRAAGQEGVMFKEMAAPYTEGRPNSGGPHIKAKHWKDISVIVTRAKTDKRSVVMGLFDDNEELVEVGAVTVPVNKAMPVDGSVLDVKYLHMTGPGGALFLPTWKRLRNDVDPQEARMSRVHYKRAHADVGPLVAQAA